MRILVRDWIKGRSSQTDQGKTIAGLVRSGLNDGETVVIDFLGIQDASENFFHEWVIPLLAEYGAECLNTRLVMENLEILIKQRLAAVRNGIDAFLDARLHAEPYQDQELFDLNFALLIKARELARETPAQARAIFGIDQEEIFSILNELTLDELQYLARSGWLCFSPRINPAFLKRLSTVGADEMDVLLVMSGRMTE